MDRIEKQIVLKATRERVWRAISDSARFGTWFGVEFDGPFIAGSPLTGRIAPTKVDPDVAKQQEPFAGMPFQIVVDRIEPMTLFSFRWHPFTIDPGHDYTQEPMTLVTFELSEIAQADELSEIAQADAAQGVRLTITESGFEQIPLARRAQAFSANEGGWAHQMRLVEKYLELDSQDRDGGG